MANIILIAGPGGFAFNSENVQKTAAAFRLAGASVTVVGNGEQPVELADISRSFERMPPSGEKTTVFVMAHGDARNGKHLINTDGNWGLSSADFLDEVARHSAGKPIDVFMTCCHGGAAIPEIERLPKGSNLVALAPGNETVAGSDVDRIADNLQEGKLDAQHLLDIYLGKSLKNRIAPVLAESGKGVYDLARDFTTQCGKPLSFKEMAHAHDRLDPVIGASTVDAIIGKISTAKSEWDIPALDFGSALAVTHAASPHIQDVASYNPNRGSYSNAAHDTPSLPTTRLTPLPFRRFTQ